MVKRSEELPVTIITSVPSIRCLDYSALGNLIEGFCFDIAKLMCSIVSQERPEIYRKVSKFVLLKNVMCFFPMILRIC